MEFGRKMESVRNGIFKENGLDRKVYIFFTLLM